MGYEIYNQARDSTLAQGRAQRAEMQEMRDRQTRRQAGNALAGGDYGGAANALLQGGDLQGGMAVQNAQRGIQTADRESQRSAIAAAASGLLHVPEADRARVFQERIAPVWQEVGLGEYVAQVRPENLSDAELRALVGSLGGEVERAPSGYRWGEGGRQEAIPGGPASAENQRWQVTPYGLIPPAGWQPPAGQQPQAPRSLGSTIPQGWSAEPPRPNQPPSAPAAGGGERSQPVSVSFRSSQEAQSAIQQIVPGVRVTSGARDAANNRRVGGAPGSFHLQDRARDLIPPAGMSMAQLAAKMRQAGFRVLNEGDHVHVSW